MTEIRVAGHGRATAVPDRAVVRFNATASRSTASEAMADAERIAAALVAVLDGHGVRPDQLAVSPDRVGQDHAEPPAPRPWSATFGVRATLTDVATAFDVIRLAASVAGVEWWNPQWGFSDDHPIHAEAQRAAVRDARARAEVYAEAAGVVLGELLSIADAGAAASGPAIGFAKAVGGAVDGPGPQEVAADVVLTFAARPG